MPNRIKVISHEPKVHRDLPTTVCQPDLEPFVQLIQSIRPKLVPLTGLVGHYVGVVCQRRGEANGLVGLWAPQGRGVPCGIEGRLHRWLRNKLEDLAYSNLIMTKHAQ